MAKAKVMQSEEGYDLYAEFYDGRGRFLESFEKGRIGALLGVLDGQRVLDCGCGSGRLSRELVKAGAEVTGIDVSEEMLKIARKNCRQAEFVRGKVTEMPFEDEGFDLVTAAFLIVHLKNLEPFFEEVYRVLKPGGRFLLTNINQKKAPKLKLKKREIVIESFYHRPQNVLKALEENFFEIEKEEFVNEGKVWINQIVLARK